MKAKQEKREQDFVLTLHSASECLFSILFKYAGFQNVFAWVTAQ